MNEAFFVVERIAGQEVPTKYYGEIPVDVVKSMVYGVRLTPDSVDLSCNYLYASYRQAVDLGALPLSNSETWPTYKRSGY